MPPMGRGHKRPGCIPHTLAHPHTATLQRRSARGLRRGRSCRNGRTRRSRRGRVRPHCWHPRRRTHGDLRRGRSRCTIGCRCRATTSRCSGRTRAEQSGTGRGLRQSPVGWPKCAAAPQPIRRSRTLSNTRGAHPARPACPTPRLLRPAQKPPPPPLPPRPTPWWPIGVAVGPRSRRQLGRACSRNARGTRAVAKGS